MAAIGGTAASVTASVTFDHLGEASDLQNGRWPADRPVGEHYTVRGVLPWLLEALREAGVRATFFVEGWNAEVYPAALAAIVGAGHEIGLHGWRHEAWSTLTATEEAQLLDRSLRAMASVGLRPVGFRAPGGYNSPATVPLLVERGFRYMSVADDSPPDDRLPNVAYGWRHVDAYYLQPHFASRRVALGDPEDVMPLGAMAEAIKAAVDEQATRGGQVTPIFHPFLMTEPDRVAAFRRVVRALLDDPRVRIASAEEAAAHRAAAGQSPVTG